MSCLQKKYLYNIKSNEPWNFIEVEIPNYDFQFDENSIEYKIFVIIIEKIEKININNIGIILEKINQENYVKIEDNELFIERILYLLKSLHTRLLLAKNYITKINVFPYNSNYYMYKLDIQLIKNAIDTFEIYQTVINLFPLNLV